MLSSHRCLCCVCVCVCVWVCERESCVLHYFRIDLDYRDLIYNQLVCCESFICEHQGPMIMSYCNDCTLATIELSWCMLCYSRFCFQNTLFWVWTWDQLNRSWYVEICSLLECLVEPGSPSFNNNRPRFTTLVSFRRIHFKCCRHTDAIHSTLISVLVRQRIPYSQHSKCWV